MPCLPLTVINYILYVNAGGRVSNHGRIESRVCAPSHSQPRPTRRNAPSCVLAHRLILDCLQSRHSMRTCSTTAAAPAAAAALIGSRRPHTRSRTLPPSEGGLHCPTSVIQQLCWHVAFMSGSVPQAPAATQGTGTTLAVRGEPAPHRRPYTTVPQSIATSLLFAGIGVSETGAAGAHARGKTRKNALQCTEFYKLTLHRVPCRNGSL